MKATIKLTSDGKFTVWLIPDPDLKSETDILRRMSEQKNLYCYFKDNTYEEKCLVIYPKEAEAQ